MGLHGGDCGVVSAEGGQSLVVWFDVGKWKFDGDKWQFDNDFK